MAVSMKHYPDNKALKVTIDGKLDSEDYSHFVPLVKDLIQQHGKLNLLVILHEFHGWTAGALWEDIKFDVQHYDDIEKLAIVGDKQWESGMAKFCKPFTSAEIRYFEREQLAQAQEWIGVTETVGVER